MNQQIDLDFCTMLIEKVGGLKAAKELLENCPPDCWTVKISDCVDDVINFSTSGEIEIATLKLAVQQVTQSNRQKFHKDLDKLVSGDYVLVPKEPTEDMIAEGADALLYSGSGGLVQRIYKAMVQAAQGEQS